MCMSARAISEEAGQSWPRDGGEKRLMLVWAAAHKTRDVISVSA